MAGPFFIASAATGGIAVIEIGPKLTKFYVHKTLLEECSRYFSNSLNGDWKESVDQKITLADIDTHTFSIFLEWLYHQSEPIAHMKWFHIRGEGTDDEYYEDCECTAKKHDEVCKCTADCFVERDKAIVKSIVFADRFDIPKYMNALVKRWVDYFIQSELPPFYQVDIFAFENLPLNSDFLRFLVDSHCAYWKEDTEAAEQLAYRAELPQEFCFRAMVRYTKIDEQPSLKDLNPFDYYKE